MRTLFVAALGIATLMLSGCGSYSRNTPVVIFTDMDYQGRYEPQGDRSFRNAQSVFADHRASRRPVEGTIARGQLREDEGFSTGVVDNQYIGRNPVTVDIDVLKHGQARFNTYCSPCHDRTGQGRGVVGQRAIWIPTNLQEPRVRDMNDGEIFNVITNGRRSMPPYKYQVVDRDRWAIVAYVRALQRATGGTVNDVPEDKRAGLK
jgi:cytochrome c5